MSKKLKIYLIVLFFICLITSCVVMNPLHENKTLENPYDSVNLPEELLKSEEHLKLRNEMYQIITTPTLQHSSINSAYPLKMMWMQMENGDWYISKFESVPGL